tara:strand:- start:281 stop:520 length:240 start_codon:yes stop_codon:yes gene_type:complete
MKTNLEHAVTVLINADYIDREEYIQITSSKYAKLYDKYMALPTHEQMELDLADNSTWLRFFLNEIPLTSKSLDFHNKVK